MASPSGQTRRALVAIVTAAVAGGPAIAQAERLGIQVTVGDASPDGDPVLDTLATLINRNGFYVRAGAASSVESALSRRANQVADTELEGYEDEVAEGRRLLEAGDCDKAREKLGRAVTLGLKASLALATNAGLRDAFRTALVGNAVCLRRAKEDAQVEQMLEETVLSFKEDRPLEKKEFGSEIFKEYGKTVTALDAEPAGTLIVEVDDGSVVIYVNERILELGHAQLDLPPGRYRVLLRKESGGTVARVHPVEIPAGETVSLAIEWRFEEALQTTDDRCVLHYPDAATRDEYLADDLRRIARATGATRVIAYGAIEGTAEMPTTIHGGIYNADTDALERLQEVPADASLDVLAQLADYWAGKRDDPPETAAPLLDAPRSSRSLARPLALGVAGIGLALIASGGVALALDEAPIQHGDQVHYYYDTKLPAVGLFVGGALVTGLGAYLYIRARGRASSTVNTASIAPLLSPNSPGLAVWGQW